MIQKMKTAFADFDFLDLKPSLLFYSKTRHVTWIGIIMSLISFCLIGAFAMFFIVQLFQRKYLVATSSTLSAPNPIINLTNLPVMFNLVDSNFDPLPDAEKVYSFQLQAINGKKNAKGEAFIFKFETCNLTKHFSSEYAGLFKNIDVSQYKCPVGIDEWNVTLTGAYGITNNYRFQSLIINRCENTTNNSKCYPKDVIETKILSVYFQMGFLDFEVNNLDFENPVTPMMKFETFPMSGTIFKRYYQFRKQAQFDSDDGFIFSEMRNKQYYQYDKTEVSVDLRPTLKFGTVNVVLSSNKQYTMRTYLKLQDVLANIGGVLNLIIFFFTVVVHFLTQRQLYLALGNENFNFDAKTKDGVENQKLKAKEKSNENHNSERHEGKYSETEINIPKESNEPIKLPYETDGWENKPPPIKTQGETYDDENKVQTQTSKQASYFPPKKRMKMNEKQIKVTEAQTLNDLFAKEELVNESFKVKQKKIVSKKEKNSIENQRVTINDLGKIHIDWKTKFWPFPNQIVLKSIEAVKIGLSMDTIVNTCADVQKLKQILFEYPEILERFNTLAGLGIHVDDYIRMSTKIHHKR